MRIMLSNRKASKAITNLSNYNNLKITIRQKFPKLKEDDVYLTYTFDDSNLQQLLLNDEDINRIKIADRNTKIYVCKALAKGQKVGSFCQSMNQSRTSSRVSYKQEKKEETSTNSSFLETEHQRIEKKDEGKQGHLQKSKIQALQYKHTGIACSECKDSPIIGHRWKCKICLQLNLCDSCYKQRKSKKDECNSLHEFYKIKNELFFKALNYGQAISLLLNPHRQNTQKQQIMLNWQDFHLKNQRFHNLIDTKRKRFKKLLNQNADNWEKQFKAQYQNNL